MAYSCLVRQVVAEYPNVCSQLHLPAQSGSTTCLERMKRGYSRHAFDALVEKARKIIPGVALSTDIITGMMVVISICVISPHCSRYWNPFFSHVHNSWCTYS